MNLSLKRTGLIVLGTIALLFIPLLAMQLTSEVNWSSSDFLVAGILLFSTAFIFDLVWRNVRNGTYRMLLLITLVVFFLLIWAELAVGVFGTPFGGS
jgi:hypothetical protein